MPTFETPEPISVSLELGVGDVRIAASDRSDTVVEVRPSDPTNKGDVSAAEQARVEYADGRLVVKAPKSWRQYSPWGECESIDVEIALPAGSRLDGEAGVAPLHCTGRVDELRYKTGVGEIHLDETGPVQIRTGAGDVSVERATGRAEITTGSGALRGRQRRRAGSRQELQRRHLDRRRCGRPPRERCQRQDRRRPTSVDGRREVRPTATSSSAPSRRERSWPRPAFGRVDIAVVDGVAAWLELKTGFGSVHNDLEAADSPAAGRGRGRDPRPNRLRRHHDPPLHRHSEREEGVMTTAATSTRPAPCDGRRGLRAAAARRRAGVGQRSFRPRCRRTWRRRRDGTRSRHSTGRLPRPAPACVSRGGGRLHRWRSRPRRHAGRTNPRPGSQRTAAALRRGARAARRLRMPAWIKAISGVFGSRTGLRWREAGSERERSASGWPRPSPTGSCGSLSRSWARSSSSSPPVRATWGSRLQLRWVRADG